MGKYELSSSVIVGNYNQERETGGKKSHGLGDGGEQQQENFIFLLSFSRGFAMGKQLKAPSHLTFKCQKRNTG